MSSTTKKVFTGEEFSGSDDLDISDVSDWIVDGMGGEPAKSILHDHDLDGNVVMGLTLKTSPDNAKVDNANVYLVGEFMRGGKEIKAKRLFIDADKDLKISYLIEEACVFSFRSGTMIGELVSDDKVTWSVYRKGSRGNTDIPEEEYEANKIASSHRSTVVFEG